MRLRTARQALVAGRVSPGRTQNGEAIELVGPARVGNRRSKAGDQAL